MIAFAAVPVLLSRLGPTHVAAHQIVLQVMLLSFLPLFALSEAVSVLIAQAVGAGRLALVGELWRLGLYVALGYAVFIGAVCWGAARPIIGVFSPDVGVIEVGAATLSVGALLQLINAAYIQLKGALRGLSVFRYVAWVTISCAWVITPPLTYLVGVRARHGAPGAWAVLCLEVSLGVVLLAFRLSRQERVGRH
jgi:MATE family multidrug resistance protein